MGFFANLLNRNAKHHIRSEPKMMPRKRSYSPKYHGSIIGGIDGARMDRFTASWSSTPVPPDQWVRSWLQILKARSRDLAMNDPYMRRYVRAVRANIVGHAGPQLRCALKLANGTPDENSIAAVSQSWAAWTRPTECDVKGRQSFTELSLSVATSLAVDGEAFVKFVITDEHGLKLQTLDSVRCPSDFDLENTAQGTFVRAGIEYDGLDRPIAYYFATDSQHGNYYAFDGRAYDRVAADEICHVFRADMVGQRRGFPWATASLFRLKRLKEFEDSAAIAAEIGACTMGIVQFPEDAGRNPDGVAEEIRFPVKAGMVLDLPDGAVMNKFDPAYPNEALGPFSKHLLQGASAGMGTSYPTAANDLADANYSSIRAGLMEERELWKEDQQLLISQFIEPVFARWLRDALLRGAVTNDRGYVLRPGKFQRTLRACAFHARRWDWVDPKSDAIANREAMTSLIKSPQEIIRERGRDPEKVLEETAQWWSRAQALGVPKQVMENAWGDTVSDSKTETSAQTQKDDKQDDDED